MTPNLAASFYLISGVLFILALRGLSSPETSRQGNVFGILGMVLAIVVTFLFVDILSSSFIFTICALVIGGSIGTIIALRISMTAMPELVAGFHSLVGLAAVFVALSAFLNPQAFNLGQPGDIDNVLNKSNIFGFLAIFLAAINIFGGFLVTQRMLKMYKKKKKTK